MKRFALGLLHSTGNKKNLMIVKCAKTGKILSSEEEIKEHAEAFGVASFEEINPETTMIWMNRSSGKYCFSKNEMDVFCKRTGESVSSFAEMTVTEFLRIRSEKIVSRRNAPVVEKYANQKYLSMLVDVRGHLVLQAEKALWITRNESVDAAHQWLLAHARDEDINAPLHPSESDVSDHGVLPPATEELIPISEYINATFLEELQGMGFDREVSIRALWRVENAGVAPAVDWLTNESNLLDSTSLPEFVPKPSNRHADPPVSKLSREEAQERALALQKRMREERQVREAAEAREKEKQRILQTKQNLEQQAQLEELQRKRDIAERERLKREAESHRAEVAEKLRQDYIERFGREPEPSVETKKIPTSPKERVIYFLTQIKKNHPVLVTKDCLSTLRVYLGNIEKDSSEKKFHRIKYVWILPLIRRPILENPTKPFRKKSHPSPRRLNS
jgi:hypothetical protein